MPPQPKVASRTQSFLVDRVVTPERWFVWVGAFLTLAALMLLWSYRFLPLYDLPIWSYEVHLLQQAASEPAFFGKYFTIVHEPVPNLGLIGPLYALGSVFPLETSMKVYLSILLVGFPWAWRFACMRILGEPTAVAYLGFVYIFNLFVFGGQSFLFGLCVALLFIGIFVPRLGRMTGTYILALSLSFLLLFFLHAIAWGVFLLVILILVGRSPTQLKTLRWMIPLAIGPSVVLALYYVVASPVPLAQSGDWGLRSVAQNLFKPPSLLLKSYGIQPAIPITIINVAWVGVLILSVGYLCYRHWTEVRRSPYFLAALCFLIIAVILPDRAGGIYQPGARFILPFLFCASAGLGRGISSRFLTVALLILAASVLAYNIYLFRAVDTEMRSLHSDIKETVDLTQPTYVVGLDWPAGTGWADAGSASVNPLSLAVYYSYFDTIAVAWVHGTGLVRLRDDQTQFQPQIAGPTRAEMTESVFRHIGDLKFFRTILIVGAGHEPDEVENLLHSNGYKTVLSKRLWRILVGQQP